MRNFAAIDFETANHHRTSVCSVGIVVVREGVIVNRIHDLIKPRPNFYARWASEIHGMNTSDTNESLDFPLVWTKIAPMIEGLPLVAHNSPFDEGCLRSVHELYEMEYPNYSFLCTCRASRRTFKNTLPNHKLHTVSAHCGYPLLNHHHALADAEACAIIAMQIL